VIKREQQRVFHEDKTAEISKASGADVRRNRDNLVIIGDDAQVAAAKKEIDAVIEKEGTVDTIDASDDTIKALTMSRAAKLKDIQTKTNTTLSADSQSGTVTILGGAKGVEQAKKDIAKFAEQVVKDQADTIAREMKVALEMIPRIIGTGGSTLKNIREKTGVMITVGRSDGTVEIRGVESSVNAAEKMITDLLNGAEKEVPEAKKSASRPPVKKKAEEYKAVADDFPTLGGDAAEEGGAAKEATTWGSGGDGWAKAMKKDYVPEQEDQAKAYPTLGGKAPAKSAPAPAPAPVAKAPAAVQEPAKEEEEEAAEDMDDPFAMMGGMGEEQVYKVSLLEEKTEQPAADDEANGDTNEEGEEDAGDIADPFEMMGGMGEETVYKVTLLDEKGAEEESAPAPSAPEPAEQPKITPMAVAAPATEGAGFMATDDDFPTLGGPAAGGARRGGKGRR